MGAAAAVGVYDPAGAVAQPPSEIAPIDDAKVPAGHGFAVPTAEPAGQKKPAGHALVTPMGAAADDAGQKKPAGQGRVVPAAWPERQKKPAGHATCAVFATTAGQNEPARHALAAGPVLEPAAERHAPGGHAAQAAAPAAIIALVLK